MANDYIPVTRTNRPQMGSEVIRTANDLIDLSDRVKALFNSASRMWDGGGHATLESQFGLTAGTGPNFLTLLGNLNDILNTSTEVTGTNRFSRLDEYKARLAGQ